MVKISDLRTREIINVVDGTRLGVIKDISFDMEQGRITSLVLPGDNKLFGFFSSGGDDLVIPWDKVKKIGLDVILVEVQSSYSHLHNDY